MIAKRIPEKNERSGKKIDVATAYGLTIEEYNRASMDFLQSEGYDSDGNEYDTLHDWLTINHGAFVDRTPWQKGDDYPDY